VEHAQLFSHIGIHNYRILVGKIWRDQTTWKIWNTCGLILKFHLKKPAVRLWTGFTQLTNS